MKRSCIALTGLLVAAYCVSGRPATSPELKWEPAAGPPRASSELTFEASDPRLVQAFAWAKAQALLYVQDDRDPVGAWYESALPPRSAFCMRDTAHQAQGAAALGLDAANLNMLRRFAAAVAPERDWAGYWEIDFTGRPALVDYNSDQDFWYNLPANFDVLDAVMRLWVWTGEERYLSDPHFRRFFQTTAKEYVQAWALEPERILTRPRIMNRRAKSGQHLEKRGIPSYTEEREDFNLGVDLLAAEYRAFMHLAFLAERDQDLKRQQEYLHTATALGQLIEQHGWSAKGQHYHGALSASGAGQGSGDAFVLYFGATRRPERIRGALAHLKSRAHLAALNIEAESYYPKLFFLHGESEAALERLLALADPARKRREYPEVSYALIDALVSGLMGIQVHPAREPLTAATIHTLARLPAGTAQARMTGVHILGGLIDVAHVGHRHTTFRNRSDKPLRWQAEFAGALEQVWVHTEPIRPRVRQSWDAKPISFVLVTVEPGSEITVRAP